MAKPIGAVPSNRAECQQQARQVRQALERALAHLGLLYLAYDGTDAQRAIAVGVTAQAVEQLLELWADIDAQL